MLFNQKGFQILFLATAIAAAESIRAGNLRRRINTERGLYYGTSNLPEPSRKPTPSPTVSWLWDNDGWTDDGLKIQTTAPTQKPTKNWGNDGWVPTNNTPTTPVASVGSKSSKVRELDVFFFANDVGQFLKHLSMHNTFKGH